MAKVEKAVALNICRLKTGKNLYKFFCPNSTIPTKLPPMSKHEYNGLTYEIDDLKKNKRGIRATYLVAPECLVEKIWKKCAGRKDKYVHEPQG